jgi:hypothetical protein
VSLTPLNNLSVVSLTQRHRRKILGFLVISLCQEYIFFAGVVDTAEQFIAGVVDTGDKYSFANISANFRKIQNGPTEYLGAWGTLIHEKNLKSKISCQTPFNVGHIFAALGSNCFFSASVALYKDTIVE